MSARSDGEPTRSIEREPAKTPYDREQQMISLADAAAEKQLKDGTASSQVIIHYLKLGTSRERLEQEKLRRENILLEQKQEILAGQVRAEEMMAEVLAAMKLYAGADEVEDEY